MIDQRGPAERGSSTSSGASGKWIATSATSGATPSRSGKRCGLSGRMSAGSMPRQPLRPRLRRFSAPSRHAAALRRSAQRSRSSTRRRRDRCHNDDRWQRQLVSDIRPPSAITASGTVGGTRPDYHHYSARHLLPGSNNFTALVARHPRPAFFASTAAVIRSRARSRSPLLYGVFTATYSAGIWIASGTVNFAAAGGCGAATGVAVGYQLSSPSGPSLTCLYHSTTFLGRPTAARDVRQ